LPQRFVSGPPQLPQNLEVSGLSELQLGQRISPTPKQSSRTLFYHDQARRS